MDRLQLLQEADRRGLLPPDKKALLSEAINRGLVKGQSDSPQEPSVSQSNAQPASGMDKMLGTPIARAALGAATAITAPFQLGANIGDKVAGSLGLDPVVGKWTNEKLAELESMKRRGMAASSGNPVGEDWDVAGAAGSLVPGAAVYKNIASMLPKALSEGGKNLAGRTAGRAISGAGTAATTVPVTSGEDFLEEKGIQAGIGGAVPVGMSAIGGLLKGGAKIAKGGYKTVRDVFRNIDPTDVGPTKLAEEHIRGLARKAGDPSAEKTISSLMKAPEIISKPNSSEAIASGNLGKPERFGGNIVRLQDELSSLPETSTKLTSKTVAGESARKSSLESIAKGISEKDITKIREDASNINYQKAFKESVESDVTLNRLMARPSMARVLSRAKDLAKENEKQFVIGKDVPEISTPGKILGTSGKPMSLTVSKEQKAKYPVESLHFMKMAMDDLIKNPERFDGIGASEVGAITKTQGEFIKWLGQKSKTYDFARSEHKKYSEVLNRVQIRDELSKVMTGPKGEERAGQFLNAMREIPKTFKRATGSSRYKDIDEALPINEAKIVRGVSKELDREAMVDRMVKEVNIPGAASPVTGNQAELPSMLYTPSMIAKWLIRQQGQEGNERVNKIAAEILSNPKQTAKVIEKVPPFLRPEVTEKISQFKQFALAQSRTAAIQGSTRSAQQENR